MKKHLLIVCCILFHVDTSRAQSSSLDDFDSKYHNWFNQDLDTNGKLGASVDKTYNELIGDKASKKTVVVAVIDSGVDIEHPDFEGKIWVNEDEIPNNGIDDDQNGYIDDVHGWNFIGNSNGENINYENLEYTRIVRKCQKENDLSGSDYARAKSLFDAEVDKRKLEKENISKFEEFYFLAKNIVEMSSGTKVNSAKDLLKVSSPDKRVMAARDFLLNKYNEGFTEDVLDQLKEANSDYLDKYLNLEFEPRQIVGDDPENLEDNQYGNADVTGPRSDHGTAVAGVIAAVRNNDLGINGVATDVKIMVVRSTPKGDERDKDVALAIRYAVENGADIINMSFGKEMSPQKQFVDDAVRYAEQNNVLMVHAAGNDGADIDTEDNFPNDSYLDGKSASNWICIGASDMEPGKDVPAIFSNYGDANVDLFAPGVSILSLDPGNAYNKNDGTSLAAPVVSGVAALLLSYYPELTPQDLIEILTKSARKIKKPKVHQPGIFEEKRKKVKFSQLSRSGGVVNAYEAFKLAGQRSSR